MDTVSPSSGLPVKAEAGAAAATPRTRWLRGLRIVPLTLGGLAIVVGIAVLPVTTKQGVDYRVTTLSLPLYLKALEFVQRDVSYGRLAATIVEGHRTDENRALRAFEWTRENVRDTPSGFPVVDDHVWHIVIRGYGADDQKADVFTTLVTYAGVPAYWFFIGPGPELPISVVKIDGRWRVMDVANGVLFRNGRGQLATAEELETDRGLVQATVGTREYRGRPYTDYFADFRAPEPPDVLHADMQMLGRRFAYEARNLVGLGGRTWQMRPLGDVPR